MSFRSSFTTDLSGGGNPRASLLSNHHHRHQSISLSSPLLTGTSPVLGTTAASAAAAAAAATAPLSPISRSLLLSSALADRKLPPVNASIFANETTNTSSRTSHHHHHNWERIRLPAPLRPEAFTVPGPPRRTLPKLPSASTSRSVFRRKRFLVFIKVLLKCLKKDGIKSPQSARLFTQAKAIIAECTQRNRQKDPHYCPLPEAVELRLRPVVGEAQWKRANACLDLYLEKRRQLHRTTAPTTVTTAPAPVDPLQVSFPEICRAASWKEHL